MAKKVLIIGDVRGWAFDRFYQGFKKNSKEWDVHNWYMNEDAPPNLEKFELILYMSGSNYLAPVFKLINNGIPKERIVVAIRSSLRDSFYEKEQSLKEYCQAVITSNEMLEGRLKSYHDKVYCLGGGVDTEFFTYKERQTPKMPRVGWCGNVKNWGESFRGVDIIQQATEGIGWIWNPAFRKDKFRTQEEMLDYYHNEIDIFVELSKSAGRQNGLIEAGACGVPIISYKCGIAKELIKDGSNGILLYKREVVILITALLELHRDYEKFSKNIKTSIDLKWSWIKQARELESIFNRITYGNL